MKKKHQDILALSEKLNSIAEDLSAAIADLPGNKNSPSSQQQQSTRALSDLGALVAYLSMAPSMKDDILLKMLLRCAMWVVKSGGAGLTLHDPVKNCLVFKAAIGDGSENIVGYEVPREGSVHGLAFATGEVQSRTPIHKKIDKKTKTTFRNVLVAPLVVEGESIGTISAVNKIGAASFTPEDMEAFKLFADLAGMMILQRHREQLLADMLLGKKGASHKESAPQLDFDKNDALAFETAKDLMKLSREHGDILPVFRQLFAQLANMNKSGIWR